MAFFEPPLPRRLPVRALQPLIVPARNKKRDRSNALRSQTKAWLGAQALEIAAHTDGEVAAHQVFARRGVDATRVAARSEDIRRDGIEDILLVEIGLHAGAIFEVEPLDDGEGQRVE